MKCHPALLSHRAITQYLVHSVPCGCFLKVVRLIIFIKLNIFFSHWFIGCVVEELFLHTFLISKLPSSFSVRVLEHSGETIKSLAKLYVSRDPVI